MDKELKRKVLFDKKSDISTTTPNPKKKVDVLKEHNKSAPNVELSNISLIDWLKARKFLKLRPMCVEAGIDPSTFHRWMKVDNEIPVHAIEKLTPLLKDYGYNAGVQPELNPDK